MRYYHCFRVLAFALTLAACKPQPVLEPQRTTPEPTDTPVPSVTSVHPSPTATASPTEADKPALALPDPPALTSAGHALLLSSSGRALVLDFETGGREGYDPHPEWPGGASGPTIGIGYDLGYYSKAVILSDWSALKQPDRTRLAGVSGLTGQRAKAAVPTIRDIFVAWAIATDVFDRVDVAREFSNAKRAVPGFEDLRPNAQAAWISLGFNRGWQMSGPNRLEMRAARDLVLSRDYSGMAIQFRKMARVWKGTSIEKGMTRRRIAEAKLLETP